MNEIEQNEQVVDDELATPRSSLRHRVRQYFRFNTYRICLLALIVAMNFVLALFGKYVLGLIPISGFLVVEVTFFTYLIAWYSINIFYAVMLIFICTWMQMLIVNDEWVGLVALNISDLLQLLLVVGFYYLFKPLIRIEQYNRKEFVLLIIAFILSVVINAALNVFWNWAFVLGWYTKFYFVPIDHNDLTFLGIIYGFNVLKYSVNAIVFIGLLRPMIAIVRKYN